MIKRKSQIKTLMTFILAMIFLVVIGIMMISQTQTSIQIGIEERAHQAVLATVKTIRNSIVSRSVHVENLSLSLDIFGNEQELVNILINTLQKDPLLEGIYVGFEQTGKLIGCKVENDGFVQWVQPEYYDPRDRLWYIEAIKSSDPIYTPAYVDVATKKYIVTIAKAIHNIDGQLMGVVGLDLPLEKIKDNLSYLETKQIGSIIIADSVGTILAHPDKGMMSHNIRALSGQMGQIGKAMVRGEKGWQIIKYRENNYYIYYQPIDVINWSVGILMPEAEVTGGSTAFLTQIGLSGYLVLISIIFFAVFISVKQKN